MFISEITTVRCYSCFNRYGGMYETNQTFREGNFKDMLTLIPGTPEQMRAEMATMKKSIRNIQMGLGGPKLPVPECPVKNKHIHPMGG